MSPKPSIQLSCPPSSGNQLALVSTSLSEAEQRRRQERHRALPVLLEGNDQNDTQVVLPTSPSPSPPKLVPSLKLVTPLEPKDFVRACADHCELQLYGVQLSDLCSERVERLHLFNKFLEEDKFQWRHPIQMDESLLVTFCWTVRSIVTSDK